MPKLAEGLVTEVATAAVPTRQAAVRPRQQRVGVVEPLGGGIRRDESYSPLSSCR
jgi:hypothetical protein